MKSILELVSDILNGLDMISNADPAQILVRQNILGKYSFAKIEADAVQLRSYVKRFPMEIIKSLPHQFLEELQLKIEAVAAQFLAMQQFDFQSASVHQPQPEVRRDVIAQDFRIAAYKLITELNRVTSIFLKPDNEANYIKKLQDDIKTVNGYAAQMTKAKDDFLKLVDTLRETTQEKGKEIGINKYSKIFAEQSEEYGRLATVWFKTVVALIVVLIAGLIVTILFVKIDANNTYEIVQYSVTKVLIISAIFYALSMCAKNYRAQKHNEVINRHKHNALTTFEAFNNSTDDKQTRNAVLLEATHTIFGNLSTGYAEDEKNDSDLPGKIIEFIKTPSQSN